jgi:chromosome segregation ATPase
MPLGRALLVIEADGRRHRFPVTPEPRITRFQQPGAWTASFALPAWLEPFLARRAFLQLGTLAIPVHEGDPAPSAQREQAASPPETEAAAQLIARVRHLERSLAAARQEPARLSAMLARAQTFVSSRKAEQERFESIQSNLRDELERARSALGQERAQREALESTVGKLTDSIAELRAELALATVSREAAEDEAAGLRAELGRLGAALTEVRENVGPGASGLGEAESLLAEARTVTARIQQRLSGSLTAADEA